MVGVDFMMTDDGGGASGLNGSTGAGLRITVSADDQHVGGGDSGLSGSEVSD